MSSSSPRPSQAPSNSPSFPLPRSPGSVLHLVLDLFTGMDGLGHALELNSVNLKALSMFTVFFETSERCRSLLAHHRVHAQSALSNVPDSDGSVGSALALSGNPDRFISWLSKFSKLSLILIAGGSPCVGFSRAKTNARGTLDKESRKIVVFPLLLAILNARLPQVQVVFLAENVLMDATPWTSACKLLIDKCLGVQPFLGKASVLTPCDRDRLFWTNLPHQELTPVQVDARAALDDGWRPLWEFPNGEPRPDLRFCTFTRGFPPGQPEELSDDQKNFPRLPLHSYQLKGLVYLASADKASLAQVSSWLRRSVNVCTKNLRVPGSSSISARASLARWIHLEGGDRLLRPLNGGERDVSLGFPRGASALPSDASAQFVLDQTQATGNAFSPPVVAHVLRPLTAVFNGSAQPSFPRPAPTELDPEVVLSSLIPQSSGGTRS